MNQAERESWLPTFEKIDSVIEEGADIWDVLRAATFLVRKVLPSSYRRDPALSAVIAALREEDDDKALLKVITLKEDTIRRLARQIKKLDQD